MFTQAFIAVVLAAISAVQGLPQVPSGGAPTPPAASTPAPMPSSSGGTACAAGQQTHTVVSGDTCTTIAQQFPGTTVQAIIQANPTINSDCTNLQPAQTICIPAGTTPAQGGAGSTPSGQTTPGGQSGATPPASGTAAGV
ncbi:carbohydrate-binding module family 50 protein [Macrolepiota fuliginosa MF-IS2]|uniref:Carbohydrate-binding module family 50 protein n=1 Tax=Macrolepiota fuliginosa MF-IS2 TaxID=1400762 RepID=A0A9P5X4N3_9AGAR|nr:carbohydrate-binding module family 50 protein [Macrolepiota fuliginosa MF-IS2]